MTYAEALKAGYQNGEVRYSSGYVSRKVNISTQEVRIAGGSRSGQLYVVVPSYHTTRYHLRQYLVK